MNQDQISEYVLQKAFDVTAPQHVEIKVRADGQVVWVNINGVCALRACQIQELVINDESKNPE